ncbi:MAG: polysaccharide deacetylase family protein [Deltaproteobacteria bacterium]|nr:polysaccharide deacetylase family protein [Deltaproteobacteria bacterium]
MFFFIVSLILTSQNLSYKPGVSISGSESEGRQVLFTFDDGPDFRTTPLLLDYLDEYGIKGAFFVNGIRFAGKNPTAVKNRVVIREIVKRGHYLGNHTWNHPMMSKISTDKQKRQILNTHKYIKRYTGTNSFLYRPPFGQMTSYSRSVLRENGYLVVMWNLDSEDPFKRHVSKNWRYVIGDIFRFGGGIVLMHDTNSWSIESIPRIVRSIKLLNCENIERGDPVIEFGSIEHFYPSERNSEPTLQQIKDGLEKRKNALKWCRNL